MVDTPSDAYLSKSSVNRWIQTALSNSKNAVSFSSARTTKRLPSSRCASAIQIVRPSRSMAETQPQLQPALLRLSVMISQYLMLSTSVTPFRRTAWLSFMAFLALTRRRFARSADRRAAGPSKGAVLIDHSSRCSRDGWQWQAVRRRDLCRRPTQRSSRNT